MRFDFALYHLAGPSQSLHGRCHTVRQVNEINFSVSPCMCVLHVLSIRTFMQGLVLPCKGLYCHARACTSMQGEARLCGRMSDATALQPCMCKVELVHRLRATIWWFRAQRHAFSSLTDATCARKPQCAI